MGNSNNTPQKTPPAPSSGVSNYAYRNLFKERVRFMLLESPESLTDIRQKYKSQYGSDPALRLDESLKTCLLTIPGVKVLNDIAELAPSDLYTVKKQLERMIELGIPRSQLRTRFKDFYNYTIPDAHSLEEYLAYETGITPRSDAKGQAGGSASVSSTNVKENSTENTGEKADTLDQFVNHSLGNIYSPEEYNLQIESILRKGPLEVEEIYNIYRRLYLTEPLLSDGSFRKRLLDIPGVNATRMSSSECVSFSQSDKNTLEIVRRQKPAQYKRLSSNKPSDKISLQECTYKNDTKEEKTCSPNQKQEINRSLSSTPTSSSSVSVDQLSSRHTVEQKTTQRVVPQEQQVMTTMKRNVSKLLHRQAMRLDMVRNAYKKSYGHNLKITGTMTNWLTSIPGIQVIVSEQMVFSSIHITMARLIMLLIDKKALQVEDINEQFQKKFGKELTFKKRTLRQWLDTIPGVCISATGLCTYLPLKTTVSNSQLPAKPTKVPPSSQSTTDLPLKTTVSNSQLPAKPTQVPPLSQSTTDVRTPAPNVPAPVRSIEQKVLDLLTDHKELTLTKFRDEYKKKYGEELDIPMKLKNWLMSMNRIHVSEDEKVSLRNFDVSTNAQENIESSLNNGRWVRIDVFEKFYKEKFGVSATETWIAGRQKEIDYLMCLNNKIRYKVLTFAQCQAYTLHLSWLCGGLLLNQAKTYFPIVYGFAMPESVFEKLKPLWQNKRLPPTHPLQEGVDILDDLKPLKMNERRALLYLMTQKKYLTIQELFTEVELGAALGPSSEMFCKCLPGVAVRNNRVKYFSLSPAFLISESLSFINLRKRTNENELLELFEFIYGLPVPVGRLPIAELKLLPQIEVQGSTFVSRSHDELAVLTIDQLILHSRLQFSRLLNIVSANPGIEIIKLNEFYREKYKVALMFPHPSLQNYLSCNREFCIKVKNVFLAVSLQEALKSLNAEEISFPETHSTASIPPPPCKAPLKPRDPSLPLSQTEKDFLLLQLSLKDLPLNALWEKYQNEYNLEISEVDFKHVVLKAGFCFVDGVFHVGCKERLRIMLHLEPIGGSDVILDFRQYFGRSPCYTGMLSNYLSSLGCEKTPRGLFQFPTNPALDVKADKTIFKKILPLISSNSHWIVISTLLDAYYKMYGQPLSKSVFLSTFTQIKTAVVAGDSVSFCGLNETSFKALKKYLEENGGSLPLRSLSCLEEELFSKTKTRLNYFGHLHLALENCGFVVEVENEIDGDQSSGVCLKLDDLALRNCVSDSNSEQDSSEIVSGAKSTADINQELRMLSDLLQSSEGLGYPNELQAKFAEKTGKNLCIAEPNDYLVKLMKQLALTVTTDGNGNIELRRNN